MQNAVLMCFFEKISVDKKSNTYTFLSNTYPNVSP
jgi:hypothetical protein